MVVPLTAKPIVFRDRCDAGQRLAAALADLPVSHDAVVFGLPRGGIPVAYEIATGLGAPLEVFVVRKLGAPGDPELAIGAISSGDVEVRNAAVVRRLGLTEADLEAVRARERAELKRREAAYRGGRPFPAMSGRTAILVDDGVATGATMRAAVRAMAMLAPASIIVAVPHGAEDALEQIAEDADQVVVLCMPEPYLAVGYWYAHFPQVPDGEVVRLLRQTQSAPGGQP
jgi:putative phosphoribosyl transferase